MSVVHKKMVLITEIAGASHSQITTAMRKLSPRFVLRPATLNRFPRQIFHRPARKSRPFFAHFDSNAMPSNNLHHQRRAIVPAGILHRSMDQLRPETFFPGFAKNFLDLPVPQAIGYTIRA